MRYAIHDVTIPKRVIEVEGLTKVDCVILAYKGKFTRTKAGE